MDNNIFNGNTPEEEKRDEPVTENTPAADEAEESVDEATDEVVLGATNEESAETPEAEPAEVPLEEATAEPVAEEPAVTPPPVQLATYSYTAGNNPSINRDTPHQGGIHTTYAPRTNTSYGSAQPNASNSAPQKTESAKKTVPMSALVICLCVAILLSAIFGAAGVAIGYNAVKDKGEAIVQNDDGNGSLDVEQGEKVVVELPEGTVAAAAESAGISVVEITTETVTTNFFYGQYVQSGAGSGVIIDADDGYIITCAHVINGASTVTVTLKDGKEYPAEIIGSDTSTDIAVIKIDAKGLVAAKVGDSDNLVVGQTAIAIGNPLGTLGGTVSSGIISALNREITIDGQDYSLLQVDTSINPGNSGGGLFDIEGNLIGVVNAKSGSSGSGTTIEGLGFAIPVNHAIEIANQLVDKGYVGGRVNLGIYVYEVNEDTNSMSLYQSEYADLLDYITAYGVYFLEYQAGQDGGFEFGDRIIAIDGVSVTTRSDITSILKDYEVGDTVPITVSRVTSDMKRSRIVEFETTLIEAVPEATDDSTTNKP